DSCSFFFYSPSCPFFSTRSLHDALPIYFSWFSQSVGKPWPGLVSTLLNHAYSTPSRLVQTFLQVTEQVWQPMHLSRFSTMPTCRSEEHTSELQSRFDLVCRLLLEKKKKK